MGSLTLLSARKALERGSFPFKIIFTELNVNK